MTVYTRPNGDDSNEWIERHPIKSPKRAIAIANRNKDHEMNVLVTDWERITRELKRRSQRISAKRRIGNRWEVKMSPEWLTTIMAFVALVFGIWQIRSSRADSREATAKQIWMEYYLRCIEYPKFANPELSKLDYKNQTLDGKKEKFFDYQWFVSFMLLACDEVI